MAVVHQTEMLPICDLLFVVSSLAVHFCDILFSVLLAYALLGASAMSPPSASVDVTAIGGVNNDGSEAAGARWSLLWPWVMVGVIVLASLVGQAYSLGWHICTGYSFACSSSTLGSQAHRPHRSSDDSMARVANPRCSLWGSYMLVFLHCLQLGVFYRYLRLLFPIEIGSFRRHLRDLCILRLLHAFLQSVPLLLIESWLLLSRKLLPLYQQRHQSRFFFAMAVNSKGSSTDGRLILPENHGDVNSLEQLAAGFALISICLALASFGKNVYCRQNLDRMVFTWLGIVCQLFWRIGTVSARFAALSLYAFLYGRWLFLLLLLHWLTVFVWLLTWFDVATASNAGSCGSCAGGNGGSNSVGVYSGDRSKSVMCSVNHLRSDSVHSGVQQKLSVIKRIYNCSLVAAIYTIDYVNLSDHDTSGGSGTNRARTGAFYTIMLLENLLIILCCFSLHHKLRDDIALVAHSGYPTPTSYTDSFQQFYASSSSQSNISLNASSGGSNQSYDLALDNRSFEISAVLVVLVGFLFGVSFMFIYYRFFHVNVLRQVCELEESATGALCAGSETRIEYMSGSQVLKDGKCNDANGNCHAINHLSEYDDRPLPGLGLKSSALPRTFAIDESCFRHNNSVQSITSDDAVACSAAQSAPIQSRSGAGVARSKRTASFAARAASVHAATESSNGGVFNCALNRAISRKKKKPSTFVPSPPPAIANTALSSGKMSQPFWKRLSIVARLSDCDSVSNAGCAGLNTSATNVVLPALSHEMLYTVQKQSKLLKSKRVKQSTEPMNIQRELVQQRRSPVPGVDPSPPISILPIASNVPQREPLESVSHPAAAIQSSLIETRAYSTDCANRPESAFPAPVPRPCDAVSSRLNQDPLSSGQACRASPAITYGYGTVELQRRIHCPPQYDENSTRPSNLGTSVTGDNNVRQSGLRESFLKRVRTTGAAVAVGNTVRMDSAKRIPPDALYSDGQQPPLPQFYRQHSRARSRSNRSRSRQRTSHFQNRSSSRCLTALQPYTQL